VAFFAVLEAVGRLVAERVQPNGAVVVGVVLTSLNGLFVAMATVSIETNGIFGFVGKITREGSRVVGEVGVGEGVVGVPEGVGKRWGEAGGDVGDASALLYLTDEDLLSPNYDVVHVVLFFLFVFG